MKQILILLIIFSNSLQLFGQNVDSLSLSFIKQAIDKYSRNDTIFYADGINKSYFSGNIKDALTHSYIKGINIQSGKRETVKIQLASEDQALLHSFMKNITKVVWQDNLFKNSVRISKDSMFAHIRNGHNLAYSTYYDSSGKSKKGDNGFINLLVRLSTVYQFGRPVFLKKKSLAVFYYLRLCGGECGDEELAVYRLEKGQYKKWLLVAGNAF